MKKILVVDDISSMRKLLVQFLSRSFDVHSEENGLKALAWLQEGNIPDLILTDMNMPDMKGDELITHLKESGYFKDIPIIVLSSEEGSESRIKCLRLGAEDYVMKPFNPEELLIRIEKVLSR